MPQGACLPSIGNRGHHTTGAHSQGLEIHRKSVGVLNALFLHCLETVNRPEQVAGFGVWQLVLVVGSFVLGGFPGDFLPVIQKGESKPLVGGFQTECTVKLSINMR